MRINTNITALNTFNSYTSANNKIADSVAKLSSGYAINSAADNAAGLAISEKMRAQIRGLDTASSNSQDAISLIQTAEGSLESADEILQRMREISVQSSSDTNEDAIDRDALQAEFSQLQAELDEIASDASFNNQKLLDGNLASSKTSATIATTASGLTASVGNADAGSYEFSVAVKTTSEAIAGSAADKIAVSTSSVNEYFSGVSTLPANTAINSTEKSALLNGNYKITGATVGEDGAITVTATGDNGQTFTAELAKDSYDTETSYTLDFGSDAFKMTFNKDTALGADPTDSEVQKLADAFVGTDFTVSGGEAAKSAEKAVYASLTGAEDVKLEVGMESATFANGVTVKFDKLTASDLDTTEKSAGLSFNSGALNVTETGAATAYTFTAAADAKGQAYTFYAESTLDGADGTTGKVTLHAVGEDGTTYTAKSDVNWDAAGDGTYAFSFEGLGTVSVTTVDAANEYATAGVSQFAGAISPSVKVAGAVASASFELGDDVSTTTVPNQTYTVDSVTDDGSSNVVITMTGADGKEYTASAAEAGFAADADATLNFYSSDDATKKTQFTLTLTMNGTGYADAAAVEGAEAALQGIKFTLGGLDKNTDEVFGADPSTITVESAKNDGLTIQVGANSGDELEINIERADSEYLGVNGLDVGTQDGASKAIDVVNKAISQVSSQRAYLGAVQNRLDYKIANLETSSQNLTSAESAIRDVDMAAEMTKFTNANILSQAATAMLAQANSLPQNVLSLLG